MFCSQALRISSNHRHPKSHKTIFLIADIYGFVKFNKCFTSWINCFCLLFSLCFIKIFCVLHVSLVQFIFHIPLQWKWHRVEVKATESEGLDSKRIHILKNFLSVTSLRGKSIFRFGRRNPKRQANYFLCSASSLSIPRENLISFVIDFGW